MDGNSWLIWLAVVGWAATLALGLWGAWRSGRWRRWRTREATSAHPDERDMAQELVQYAPMAIILLDSQGRILMANPFAAQLLGRPVADLVERDGLALALPPSQHETIRQMLAQDWAGHVTTHFIMPVLVGDGRTAQVEWCDTLLRDADGQPKALLVMGLEVTERLAAQEALAESERTLRGLVESSQDGITLMDEEGVVTEWNAALERITSIPAAEALGRKTWDVQFEMLPSERQTPEAFAAVQAMYADFLRTGEAPWLARPATHEFVDGAGKRRVTQNVISVIHTEKGHRAVSISRDVTAQAQAEQALRASEARYRGLVESLQEGIWVVDAEATVTFVNPRMAEMLGYLPEEMIGRSLFDFVRPEDVPDIERRLEARAQGIAEQHEAAFPRKNGEPLYVRMSSAPLTDGQGRFAGVVAALTDIESERREAEALREREGRYHDLIENAGDLIQSMSPEGALLYVNRAWREALGYSEEEARTLNLLDVLHLDCRQRCLREMARVLQGERLDDMSAVFLAKDGRVVPVVGSVSCRMENGMPMATRGVFRRLMAVNAAQTALTPICASCKKVRQGEGVWQSIEDYLQEAHHLRLTHGICPDCMATLYAEFMDGAEGAE